MEEKVKCEQIGLIGELIEGKELAKQLCDHLFSPSSSSSTSSSSSNVKNEVLIEKILSSYEKALTMLNWKANVGESCKSNNGGKIMDSHCSYDGSPRSEVLDPEVQHKNGSKKRKTMPKWTEQVKVSSGTTLEGSLDDGYGWRKYGQKDILGAKFPRGYYRCTHRHVQGCQATKQVQKSDKDPNMYEITYKGKHTCNQASQGNKAIPSKKLKMDLGENKHHNNQTHQKNQPQQEEEKTAQPQQESLCFGSELELKIEDYKEDIFPSFWLSSSPSRGSEKEDNNMFNENNFIESFSPAFMSPTTSELGEFDLTEIASTPTSSTNYGMIDLDLFLDNMDFDTDFPINNPELCS